MKFIIVFFLLLSSIHAYYDGNSMIKCHDFVMERKHNLDERGVVFCTFNAGFITGAIKAVLNEQPSRYFIPKNITSKELVKQVLNYYVQHPQVLNYELHKVVKLVLIKNYYVK